MTNAEIIRGMQEQLVEDGILRYTGRILKVELEDGEILQIKEIQPIHTYNGWKTRGYQVKKGEKAVTKFAVWKPSTKKKKVEDEDGEEKEVTTGRMFMKVSAFFTDEQVERIKEGK